MKIPLHPLPPKTDEILNLLKPRLAVNVQRQKTCNHIHEHAMVDRSAGGNHCQHINVLLELPEQDKGKRNICND